MTWNFNDFDLSLWKVTMPVDGDYYESDGGDGDFTDDTAYEIKDIEGWEDPDFFFYNQSEGTMVFSSPVVGAKTSANTKYTRSELREREINENGSTVDASWTINEGGTLSATLKVTELATEDDGDPARVIIGQIHGENDELVRIYYNADGELYYANEITGSDGAERLFYFENANGDSPDVSLGEQFSYIIDVANDELVVQIYADGQVYDAVATDGVDPKEIVSTWYNDTFYFKAGVYQGVTDISGHAAEGSGTVTAAFYDIDVSHTPGEGRDAWLGEGLGGSFNEIDGTSGADLIAGTSGADLIDGGSSGDTLRGNDGDDSLIGGGGWDSVVGGNGDDTLSGDAGNDTLKAGAGNDVLIGGTGSDIMWGNAGNDTIYAGAGADWLKGGGGADVFVFSAESGKDTIADFSLPNGDKLDFSDFFNSTPSDAIGDGYVEFVQSGADTKVYVDLDGDSGSGGRTEIATLLAETASAIQNDDLIF